MGRASDLTPEVQRMVVEGIKAGLHIVRAAEKAGIGESTFYRWMEKGDPARQPEQPDLANMARKDLQKLATAHGVPYTAKTTRKALAVALEAAGAGSWDRYVKFREAVEEAEAELEQRVTAQWQLTMQPITMPGPPDAAGRPTQIVRQHANYNSMATFLARRFPARWSPKVLLELSGRDGGPIVTREERSERLADWLEGMLDGNPPEEIGEAVVEIESRAAAQ